MQEAPHPKLLNREDQEKAIREGYAPQLALLTDMVNYASNLVPRVYQRSEKTLRDIIVCFDLLKQFATMLDAVDTLMRSGSVTAAYVPARAAFEASVYLEWILVADGEKKAAHYVVGNIREERIWGKRAMVGSPESTAFLKAMGDIGKDLLEQRPSLEDEAKAHVAEADRILAQPTLVETNAAFNSFVAQQVKKGRMPREPHWYQVLGKPTIRSIAKELERLPEYIAHYEKGSKVVHSSSYKDHIKFQKNGAIGHPIRNLADAHNVFNHVFCNALHTFVWVLRYYRGDELERFGAKYVQDWRQAFTHIPRIKIAPKAETMS
jgi:hypothetical protein